MFEQACLLQCQTGTICLTTPGYLLISRPRPRPTGSRYVSFNRFLYRCHLSPAAPLTFSNLAPFPFGADQTTNDRLEQFKQGGVCTALEILLDLCYLGTDATWNCFGPAHHSHQLSFPELVEAGEEGRRAVGLGGVVSGVDHVGLDGLKDAEQRQAGAQGWRDIKKQGLMSC